MRSMLELQNKMVAEIASLRARCTTIEQEKVGRNEIEAHIFRVDAEILNDPKLKSYYDALYDRLYVALREAEVICAGGNLALNTSNISLSALSTAISLIPMVGNLLSSGFQAATDLARNNDIKSQAVIFKSTMGLDPAERENAVKRIAEIATLKNKIKISNVEINQEVEHWINTGTISRCRNFFVLNVAIEIYQGKAQILGCIDALKIIYSISTDQIPRGLGTDEVISRLSSVPVAFKFSKGKIVRSNTEQRVCCVMF